MAVVSSCNKSLLDTTPEASLSSSSIFSTAKRIEGLVNGMYGDLKAANLYGGRYLLFQDVRGEEFLNITASLYTGYETWGNSNTSGSNDVNYVWTAAYAVVNDANILISGLNGVSGVITDSLKKQYVAEARFARALSYFSLITLYSKPYNADAGASRGLPLRLQAELSSGNNDLAASSVAAIYQQIITDLDSAEAGLPQVYSSDLLNTTRAHKSTAIALKTRVYLNKGDYDKTIAEAVKLVPQTSAPFKTTTGVQHALQSSIATLFSSNYVTTESIFSMPMTSSSSLSGQSAIGYIYYINKEYYLNAAGIFGDSQWGSTDARRDFLSLSGSKYYLKKYAKSSPYVDYIPVIRYAEVLLNYAEAAAKKGSLTLAQNLLKAVHSRSDASYTFTDAQIGTADALVSTILKERRIELLGEGFRSNDLLRNLQTIPAKGDASLQSAAVSSSASNYIFPLPSGELTTNTLLHD
ncbi:outer membrane protein, nutrient binding [Filimonas lacunae]|nr:outer membrane protein, nutrient binding [Filimonas lacunae]